MSLLLRRWAPGLMVLLLLLTSLPASAGPSAPKLVVGSKKFPESALLAELLSQALEAHGLRVERRINLGNTAVAFAALEHGSIDVYPEYSGTLLELLKIERKRLATNSEADLIRHQLKSQYGLFWGPALGFNNSYGMAVRQAFAATHHLRTMSDLARLGRSRPLKAALSHEFLARDDGYAPLARHYGLAFEVRGTEHGVAYQLIAKDKVDVIDVYTSEGLIREHELLVLADDEAFFPNYSAGYVFGPRLAQSAKALRVLNDLSGTLSDTRIRALNHAVEVQGKPLADLARSVLDEAPHKPAPGALRATDRKQLGFWALLAHDRRELWGHVVRHLELTLFGMLLSVLFGIPLGYLASRSTLWASLSLGVSGALQTIPSLALLVLAIPVTTTLLTPLGQGHWALEAAALLALFLYSLLPVVRNTKEGLLGIDRAILEAARGNGMTEAQVLLWVQLPLALPVILAGVRTAFVITVGTATLAAFVGAGGLGVPIISGLSVQNFAQVWTGAVPAALLALTSDALFAVIQRRLTRKMGGETSKARLP